MIISAAQRSEGEGSTTGDRNEQGSRTMNVMWMLHLVSICVIVDKEWVTAASLYRLIHVAVTVSLIVTR